MKGTKIDRVEAVFETILDGAHGRYMVCTPINEKRIDGSVTLSIEKRDNQWLENSEPIEGSVVILAGVWSKRGGWRATTGRIKTLADQQTANEESKTPEGRRERLLSKAYESTWRRWVELMSIQSHPQELFNLLKDTSIGDPYKARALCVLLAPSFDKIPCYWKEREGEESYAGNCKELFKLVGSLSLELTLFLADLVLELYPHLKMHSHFKNHADALRSFNRLVHELVADLQGVEAARIFPLFEIEERNLSASSTPREPKFVFDPFKWFLADGRIGRHWKRLVDNDMRARILREFAERTKGQDPNQGEELFRYYVDCLLDQIDKAGYDASLLGDQISFIITSTPRNLKERDLISPNFTPRVFKRLEKEKRTDLVIAFAQFVMSPHSRTKIIIHDEESSAAAVLMRGSLMGAISSAEMAQLDEMISSSSERLKKRLEQQRLAQEITGRVLAAMRAR